MYMEELQFYPMAQAKGFHFRGRLSQNTDFNSVAYSIASFKFTLNSF